MDDKTKKLIQSIPIWKNSIEIKTIDGGLTNQNFLVQENSSKFVVRLGDDIPARHAAVALVNSVARFI